MSITREEKEAMIASLSQVFSDAQIGFLVDYRGLNVAQVTDLRRQLNESDTRLRVLKNRLAKIAVEGTAFEGFKEHLTDTRALIHNDSDPVAPAKVVSKYESDVEKFQFITGVLVTDGRASELTLQQVKALADLPSREELLTKLLFVMQAPATNFVRTLNEVPGKFVRTLAALAREREENAA